MLQRYNGWVAPYNEWLMSPVSESVRIQWLAKRCYPDSLPCYIPIHYTAYLATLSPLGTTF